MWHLWYKGETATELGPNIFLTLSACAPYMTYPIRWTASPSTADCSHMHLLLASCAFWPLCPLHMECSLPILPPSSTFSMESSQTTQVYLVLIVFSPPKALVIQTTELAHSHSHIICLYLTLSHLYVCRHTKSAGLCNMETVSFLP